jgi:gliding motility-associated protein GldM
MALPKEPRQKMINMMYLVLTALLALNVSSEILNAFKTVNNSINTSNRMIDEKNAVTYNSFEEKLKDQQTAAKAAIWAPKANEVKKLSGDMITYIESLKTQLVKEAGTFEKDGVTEMNADNLDAATRLMDVNGKGAELYNKLGTFRKQVIGILKPEEFADNPKLQEDMKQEIAKFNKTIPIDLTVKPSTTGQKLSNDAKGWTQMNFHMTPAIAAMTILSKLQNDIKNSEAQMVDYLHRQIGEVKVVFNKYQAIAQANTTYGMPGDELAITAGVGAFSDAAAPKIYIDGKLQPLQGDGTALYKTKIAGGAGDKVIDVKIEYTDADGKVNTVSKPVKYTVGIPSGASIFLEKMNVMYLDVENPVTISGGSVGSEKVRVSFTAGSITKTGGDKYVAVPKGNPGPGTINVVADGKTFPFAIRVKSLPSPAGFVGGKKGGPMSAAEFKVMRAVIAKLEDSEFQFPFKVLSYKVGAVGGPISIYAEETNNGNAWNGQAGALINRAGPGTTVFFDQIIVEGPGGKKREISPMKFNLR